MLLMFGVGLHFSVDDLIAVRGIAIPGAVGQILIATAIGAAWPLRGGIWPACWASASRSRARSCC